MAREHVLAACCALVSATCRETPLGEVDFNCNLICAEEKQGFLHVQSQVRGGDRGLGQQPRGGGAAAQPCTSQPCRFLTAPLRLFHGNGDAGSTELRNSRLLPAATCEQREEPQASSAEGPRAGSPGRPAATPAPERHGNGTGVPKPWAYGVSLPSRRQATITLMMYDHLIIPIQQSISFNQ